jgi:hypothetical protein
LGKSQECGETQDAEIGDAGHVLLHYRL